MKWDFHRIVFYKYYNRLEEAKELQIKIRKESSRRFNVMTENWMTWSGWVNWTRLFGRDEEIRRALQLLCRRTKNNLVVISEPGEGKTAIYKGFAYRILTGDILENLKTKRIVTLDIGAPLIREKSMKISAENQNQINIEIK